MQVWSFHWEDHVLEITFQKSKLMCICTGHRNTWHLVCCVCWERSHPLLAAVGEITRCVLILLWFFVGMVLHRIYGKHWTHDRTRCGSHSCLADEPGGESLVHISALRTFVDCEHMHRRSLIFYCVLVVAFSHNTACRTRFHRPLRLSTGILGEAAPFFLHKGPRVCAVIFVLCARIYIYIFSAHISWWNCLIFLLHNTALVLYYWNT